MTQGRPTGSQRTDSELDRYQTELEGILSRFTHTRDGIHINRADDAVFRQYVHELVDLFSDTLGSSNRYSPQVAQEANEGVSNFTGSPSYKSVENILSIVRAARTRLLGTPTHFRMAKQFEILGLGRTSLSFTVEMKRSGASLRTSSRMSSGSIL